MAGPLDGLRVIDLSRLAPGPFCTMLLADLGADVIAVGGGRAGGAVEALQRNKRQVTLDLKTEAGRAALHTMVRGADVVVEGFRPGVAARLGADAESLLAIDNRLVVCSITGYGQDGPWAQAPGHDINYVAIAGVLGAVERPDRLPHPPLNSLADYAGGGLLAAFGILAALREREVSGRGQHIDSAMVDGVVALMANNAAEYGSPILPNRGHGLTAGSAPFYRCYRCSDDRYVAVGAVEPAFFEALWDGLGYDDPVPDHLDPVTWPALIERFEVTFAERTRDEWAAHFAGDPAAVTPVLDPAEARAHEYHRSRGTFLEDGSPAPVPRFHRTPAARPQPSEEDRTAAILAELGVAEDVVNDVLAAGRGAAITGIASWPPF